MINRRNLLRARLLSRCLACSRWCRVLSDSCTCLDLQYAGGVVEQLAGTLIKGNLLLEHCKPVSVAVKCRSICCIVSGIDSSSPSAEMHLPAICL